jgi:hypothetical protein
MLGKDLLDAFGRQNVGKRQSRLSQERIGDLLETAAVIVVELW